MTKFQEILTGYKHLIYFILKILTLLALCLIIGSIIVFPLWYFATKTPTAYTGVVITLIVAVCLFHFFRICKKTPRRILLKRIIQIVIIIATLVGCIISVFAGLRILCIPILLISFLLFGLCTFAYREH